MAIFDHLVLRNPWTDWVKIWHHWLCPAPDPACKNLWPPDKRGWGGGMGEVVTSCVFFLFPLVSWTHAQLTLRIMVWRSMHPMTCFVQISFLWDHFPQRVSFPRFYPKNQNFGGVNRHLKPNLQKIKSPYLQNLKTYCASDWQNLTNWCDLPQRLCGWSYEHTTIPRWRTAVQPIAIIRAQ